MLCDSPLMQNTKSQEQTIRIEELRNVARSIHQQATDLQEAMKLAASTQDIRQRKVHTRLIGFAYGDGQ